MQGCRVGTRKKTLRDEYGHKTVLLKLPKGFHANAHSHIYDEQHLIISGEYESEGKEFSHGTYRFIHAGQDHGPFSSQNGAVILII